MTRPGPQGKLFDLPHQLASGLVYRPEFITAAEEAEILSLFEHLPFEHSEFGEYTAKRRHIGFGWGYDEDERKFVPGPPLPPFLRTLQIRIGKWLDIPKERVVEALVNEYSEGSGIGWHSDREEFEHIVGISLGGWARMRFRPLARRGERESKNVVSLELEPRSAYIMQKEVRWRWQHSVAPTRALRYSITFRTLPAGVRIPKKRRVASADVPLKRHVDEEE
ncbi:alpha-ketoglutarate-dependent dioxygenase AlkB [Candidatus Parcubacteria bacterium]|nr:alpha-ketoglutarate-dependent dioxygenase AlkB [Candidatus Parcubacteria bacterium]